VKLGAMGVAALIAQRHEGVGGRDRARKCLAFLETHVPRRVLRNRDLCVSLQPRKAPARESKQKIDAFGWTCAFLAKN
jgi:hypothetical protein